MSAPFHGAHSLNLAEDPQELADRKVAFSGEGLDRKWLVEFLLHLCQRRGDAVEFSGTRVRALLIASNYDGRELEEQAQEHKSESAFLMTLLAIHGLEETSRLDKLALVEGKERPLGFLS
jgi:hypothetical protein